MSPLRVIRQRFLMCLGLAMVIAGGTAASMGYLAANDAKSRPAVVVTSQQATAAAGQPTTKRAAAGATTKKKSTVASKSGRTTASRKRAAAAKLAQRKPAATTRNAAVITVDANANTKVAGKYRGMMWWGGAMLVVGLTSVGYSIHERRPKPPPSGADELLNDAPPF
jgi:hypothetical protein